MAGEPFEPPRKPKQIFPNLKRNLNIKPHQVKIMTILRHATQNHQNYSSVEVAFNKIIIQKIHYDKHSEDTQKIK